MKKKTIITSLALLAAAAMVGVGTSVGLTAIDTPDQVAAVDTDEEGYLLIKNKDDLLAVFDGNATYYQKNIRLAADIDMEGHVFQNGNGMAGAFEGTFDGNGHKIYNLGTTNGNKMFTEVAGTIKSLTIEYVDSDAGEIRSNYFFANGYTSSAMIENVHMVYSFFDGGVYSSGLFGFSAAAGATFTNCSTHAIGNGDMADLSALVWGNPAGVNITNCTKTIDWVGTGQIGSGYNDLGEKFTTTTETSYIYLPQKTVELAAGDSVDVSAITCGAEYNGVNWETEGQNVEISNGTGSGFTLTASEPGDATVVGTYTTASGTLTAEVTVHVSEAAEVTGVHIENENISATLEEESSIEISAKLEGNIYHSAVWESSDPDALKVEASEDDPLSATITAIHPTDEPVTITFNVYGEDGEKLATDSIEITVTEIIEYNVNVFVPTTLSENQANNGNLPVGNFLTNSGTLAITPDNPSRSIFSINAGTKGVVEVNGQDCYLLRFNLMDKNIHAAESTTLNMYFAYAGGQSDGVELINEVYADGEYNDVSVYWNVDTDQLQVLQATEADGNEYNKAADFLFDVIAPNLRQNGDMCYLIEEGGEENLNKVLGGYTSLDYETKTIVDGTKDPNPSMSDDQNTLANTMAYLLARSVAQDDGSYVAQAKLNNQALEMNAQTIIALALVGGISISALVYMALRKKSKKSE